MKIEKYQILVLYQSRISKMSKMTLIEKYVDLIRKAEVCKESERKNVKERLYQLSLDSLPKYSLMERLTNYELHTQLSCILTSVYYPFEFSEMTKKILKDVISVNSGEQSIIYSAKSSPLILVKDPKVTEDTDEVEANLNLVREALIGIRALNILRKFIPTFNYIYCIINCGNCCNEEIVEGVCPTGSEVDLCSVRRNHYQMLMENITNAVTLGTYIKDNISIITIDWIYGILLQIFNALRIAFEGSSFTHYDLNYDNILIQSLDKEFQLSILEPTEDRRVGMKGILPVNQLARIIDYGFHS